MSHRIRINGEEEVYQFLYQIPVTVFRKLAQEYSYDEIKQFFSESNRITTTRLIILKREYDALTNEDQRSFSEATPRLKFDDPITDRLGNLFYISTQWGLTNNPQWDRFLKSLTDLPKGNVYQFEYLGRVPRQANEQNFETLPPDNDNHDDIMTHPNTILFGPPGTGKTHNSIQRALAILDPSLINEKEKPKNIKALKARFPEQVEFVTFHQSMSYEDFVEGVKAESHNGQLHYRVQDGIFKRMATLAHYDLVCWTEPNSVKEITFEELYNQFLQSLDQQLPYELTTKENKSVYINTISDNQNLYISHQDSILKYTVSKRRLEKLYQRWSSANRFALITNITEEFRAVIGGCNTSVYWAVLDKILQIKGLIQQDYDDFSLYQEEYFVDYEDKKNRLLSLTTSKDYLGEPRNYVLIIDEINRGNMSRIFGELITLIESSKRLGAKEEITLTLPYSGDDFGVPKNLYIIGTMNTADRSLALMDTALRRRFDFIEMMPNADLLNTHVEDVNLRLLLSAMNERIEALYDREHTLGHAFLMNIAEFSELKEAFRNKILPLLEEYFFEDWEKIQWVLGDAPFYKKKETIVGGKSYVRYSRDDQALEHVENYRKIYA